ncbi:ABC transporter substrate-binding protein [Alcanivorax marinus]|uniref:Thiamine pyrimidine synthase n=1 Tax=Alloalcanivorax marinus TaxID=1177169 RepID=A0A9Q3YR73_9GAMM|nr:ABC transporter substrate-binding protein [Alloalcanivorax marinus]MCC4310545.1 ABC transporter substrate-binding protein [Alloalcanivorax marinus]MCU5788264.1 hypothetical protein [Alloalcanivorax marinus]
MKVRALRSILFALGVSTLTAGAQAADKIRWLNDWLPAGDKAVIYLGVQEGLFKDAGIEVEIMTGRGSSDVVTKLGTGAGDMGSGGLSALMQAKAGAEVPVTAVMSIYTRQPDAVFVAEGAGIDDLKDLQGKTLATATFSASNVTWPLVLEANGMTPDAVKVLKVDPGAMGPMFATGRVDGTINWITKLPAFQALAKDAGKTVKVLPWSEYGFNGYGLSMFASDRLIEENPALVKKFVAVYKQALGMAVADPAKAGAALKAMVPDIDADIAAEEFAVSAQLIDTDIAKQDGLGAFEPELLKETWTWVAKAQNLPVDALDPEDAVTRAFIPE